MYFVLVKGRYRFLISIIKGFLLGRDRRFIGEMRRRGFMGFVSFFFLGDWIGFGLRDRE